MILAVTTLCVVFAACSDDEPVVPPTPEPFNLPESPGAVMISFAIAHETLDRDLYWSLLHPEFEMVLQQETIEQFPDIGPRLEIDEEIRITDRMFSGNDLIDPNGALVPGVVAIHLEKFNPELDWQVSPSDDPIPNVLFAPYQVEFLFNRGQSYSQAFAVGQARFYVAARDSVHEGETREYFQLIGIVDLTLGSYKATEQECWGSFKALYR
jgi:hypothetical protein